MKRTFPRAPWHASVGGGSVQDAERERFCPTKSGKPMRRFLTLLSVGCALTGCLSGRSESQENAPVGRRDIRHNADELTKRLRDLVANGTLADRLAVEQALNIEIGRSEAFNEFWSKSRVEGWLAPEEFRDVAYVLAVPDKGHAPGTQVRAAELLISLKSAPCVEESSLSRTFKPRLWKLSTRWRQSPDGSDQPTLAQATFVAIARSPGKGSVEFRFGSQPKGCAESAYLVQDRVTPKPRREPKNPRHPTKGSASGPNG
jgi:hypothetical protein